MKTSIRLAATGIAIVIASAAAAQQPPGQDNVLAQLLGAMFGSNQQVTEQALDQDWDQGRRPFAQRRDQLDQRIDTAVRAGDLSPAEAEQMRREYNDIVRVEEQYSADGNVSQQQRDDLRMRYRALTQRVSSGGYGQNGNGQGYGQADYPPDGRWQPLSTRNAEFEQSLSIGLRNRSLTQAEAGRLRSDWRALAQIEANYQRGGIDAREQADLWNRFTVIDNRLEGLTGSRISGRYGDDRNTARWNRLETRLAAAERNGALTRNDAVQIRAQLSDLARLDTAYAAGGYRAGERAYLVRRFGEIEATMDNRR